MQSSRMTANRAAAIAMRRYCRARKALEGKCREKAKVAAGLDYIQVQYAGLLIRNPNLM